MEINFKNKIIVVIGGTTGIGKATAKLFAQSGGMVVFTGLEEKKDVAFLREAEDLSIDSLLDYQRHDITRENEVIQFADYVREKYGGCDVLFNNAGILLGSTLQETSLQDWNKVLSVNLTGFFLTSKYFIPHMIQKGGGAIVNTSSISGLFGDYACCAYNVSKGGVTNLTRSMALDYARYHIRVNAVCPGSVRTKMYEACEKSMGKEKCRELFCKAYPCNRIGEPEEIANAVVFLASDLASYITGANLSVDGGLSAHTGQPTF